MVYVTSDWHGVPFAVIQDLLGQAHVSDEDTLYVLGDVIDRGEHGVELLKWLMDRPNTHLLLGNHEAMLLSCAFLFREITDDAHATLHTGDLSALHEWNENGAGPTVAALNRESAEMRAAILDFVQKAPLYATVSVGGRDYALVHGGLGNYEPDRPLSDYTPYELLWERPYWETRYSEAFTTVVGHTPTGFYGYGCRGRILKTDTWWDIDTGASSGRYPMLLCLDTLEEFYPKNAEFH